MSARCSLLALSLVIVPALPAYGAEVDIYLKREINGCADIFTLRDEIAGLARRRATLFAAQATAISAGDNARAQEIGTEIATLDAEGKRRGLLLAVLSRQWLDFVDTPKPTEGYPRFILGLTQRGSEPAIARLTDVRMTFRTTDVPVFAGSSIKLVHFPLVEQSVLRNLGTRFGSRTPEDNLRAAAKGRQDVPEWPRPGKVGLAFYPPAQTASFECQNFIRAGRLSDFPIGAQPNCDLLNTPAIRFNLSKGDFCTRTPEGISEAMRVELQFKLPDVDDQPYLVRYHLGLAPEPIAGSADAQRRILQVNEALDPFVKDLVLDVFGDTELYVVRDDILAPYTSDVTGLRGALKSLRAAIVAGGDLPSDNALKSGFSLLGERYHFTEKGEATWSLNLPRSGELGLSFVRFGKSVRLSRITLGGQIRWSDGGM